MRRHIEESPPQVRADGWVYRGADRRLELSVAMVAALANQVANSLGLARSVLDSTVSEWRVANDPRLHATTEM